MHSFKTTIGEQEHEWRVNLNGWQLKTLKQELRFDARDPESIMQAANDPALLCDVLYVLRRDQCQAAKVTDRQFGESLAGDAIDAAAEAYMQETVDFFPQRQQSTLRALLAKIKAAQDRATKLAEEKVNSPAMDEAIERALTDASRNADKLLAGTSIGNSSGNASALQDLIHSPSRLESLSGLTGGMNTPLGNGQRSSAR